MSDVITSTRENPTELDQQHEATLVCQHLSKTFIDGELSVPVLQDVNLTVSRAECLAIIGPSGSGKSTLLHLLGGLDKPTRGQVLLNQQDLSTVSEKQLCQIRNRHLGFIYQFHHLLPEFSAAENVAMPLLVRGDKSAQALAEAHEMLARVGLAQRVNHTMGQLSGGERQRTAIARALVTKPSVVLADEPTGNLDHETAANIYDTLLTLNKELSTSIVIVTHDLRLAKQLGRIVSLEQGRLAEVC